MIRMLMYHRRRLRLFGLPRFTVTTRGEGRAARLDTFIEPGMLWVLLLMLVAVLVTTHLVRMLRRRMRVQTRNGGIGSGRRMNETKPNDDRSTA